MRNATLLLGIALVAPHAWGQLLVDVRFDPPVQVLGCRVTPIVTFHNPGREPTRMPTDRLVSAAVQFSAPDHPEVKFHQIPFGARVWQEIGPGERKEYRLKPDRGPYVCSPGPYSVRVALWDEVVKPVGITDYRGGEPGRVEFLAPTGVTEEAFKAALLLFPQDDSLSRDPARLRQTPCRESQVWWVFQQHPELVRAYPRAVYSGYVLAGLSFIPPGVGDTPGDKVRQYTAADFFERFPTSVYGALPCEDHVPMHDAVSERAYLIRTYLEEFPAFELREKLEAHLGDLELILGNYERARASYLWLDEHGVTDAKLWAAAKAKAMEDMGLIRAPGKSQLPEGALR